MACSTAAWHKSFTSGPIVDVVKSDAPFLKCHTRDGNVYVLENWSTDIASRAVSGSGLLYDADRRLVKGGSFRIPFDQVALLETNHPETVVHTGMVVMGVLTGASMAATMLCIANPKACFGSCPTFYVSDGERDVLQAEGFSEAIAPSLEKSDIDALYLANPHVGDAQFRVRMTNEALETHVVNSVRVLAVPRSYGERVFHTRSGFVAASSVVAPASCHSEVGNCMPAVRQVDQLEYRSLADEQDLATREVIDLEFPTPGKPGAYGVVVRARKTLLETYLFYQMLAYAGRATGEWLTLLDRGGPVVKEKFAGPGALLGDIDVAVETAGSWRKVGSFQEVGPIARETQLILLPDVRRGDAGGTMRVRLTLTRGNWRIDYVALAELAGPRAPITLTPTRVERAGEGDTEAQARLTDPTRHLVTYPGDEYTLLFDAPPANSELFLESRGYYIEWVREQWLSEENPDRITEMVGAPSATLRRLAPEFKKLEPTMEEIFWSSGYAP